MSPAFIAAIALASAALQPNDSQVKAEEAAKALDRLADEFEREMSSEEQSRFRSEVERSATAELQALAKKCGTTLIFSDEPRFEDRSVWTAANAEAEQVRCVQKQLPFVKASPK